MRRLNFHHLHYFWAVAKEGNLTRAAQSLHVPSRHFRRRSAPSRSSSAMRCSSAPGVLYC